MIILTETQKEIAKVRTLYYFDLTEEQRKDADVELQKTMDMFSRSTSNSGFVYIIKDKSGLGFYRIGQTQNTVKERVNKYIPKLPFDMEIVAEIFSKDCKKLEGKLFERFKETRIRGDWFKLTNSDVESILSEFGYGYE